jgi:hypothetical protein
MGLAVVSVLGEVAVALSSGGSQQHGTASGVRRVVQLKGPVVDLGPCKLSRAA